MLILDINNNLKNNIYQTFDLSKSGVSSVVVLIGIRVGENLFIALRDAEPTACADADDACMNKNMEKFNSLRALFSLT